MSYVGAKTAIGYFCAHGMCGDQDYEEAFKWYKEASDEGSGEASFNIGYLYANAASGEVDIDEALNGGVCQLSRDMNLPNKLCH